MATGDKIFIADKQTLDETKQLVEESKQVLDNTKQSVDSLALSKDSSTPFTVSNLNKLYYLSQTFQGTQGTINAVNLTQPGTLYLVYVSASANYQTTVDVIVDGTIIYRYNQAYENPYYAGLVTSQSILGVNSVSNFVLINNKTLPVNIVTPINRSYSGQVVISMKPIKFNNSLVVRCTVAGTGVSSVDVYYELD